MVDKGFFEDKRTKRGALVSRTGKNYYWPATASASNRIVRVPYLLNAGFFGTYSALDYFFSHLFRASVTKI